MIQRSPILRQPGVRGQATRGFSLVELVLVLTIVAVLAGMAAPRYHRALTRFRVQVAARRVVADLAMAQQWARTKSAAVTVSFNAPKNFYGIAGLRALDHPGNAYQVQLGQAPYQVRIASAAFGADSDVIFNGYGLPDTSGTVVVTAGEHSARVELQAATGRARIQ